MQCGYTGNKKNNAEKMQEIQKCYDFLEELNQAIARIPAEKKKTTFAGNICEDIRKIAQREQTIIDLIAENIKLTET